MQESRKKTLMVQPDRPESPATPAVEWVTIGPESEGQRVDNFLFRHLKGVPKSRIYRMLRGGEVRINKKRADPAYHLQLDDLLRIPPVRVAERAVAPAHAGGGEPMLPRVLYRDDSLMVLDKPAGQAVHGGSGISLGIIEQLRAEMPEQRFLELAHRLDRDTSGVLILALRRSALTALHEMLRQGIIRKTYLALVIGHWRDAVRNVKYPLLRHLGEDGERRVRVDMEAGQKAHTIFRLVRRYAGFSLLEVELKTGRTHQIRVHAAACKHPLAGDAKYGDPERNAALKKQGLRRMFLHAARLEFPHPLTGQALDIRAPLAGELEHFLNGLENAP